MGVYAELDTGYQLKLTGMFEATAKFLYGVDYFDHPTLDWFQLNTITTMMADSLIQADDCEVNDFCELVDWLQTDGVDCCRHCRTLTF